MSDSKILHMEQKQCSVYYIVRRGEVYGCRNLLVSQQINEQCVKPKFCLKVWIRFQIYTTMVDVHIIY